MKNYAEFAVKVPHEIEFMRKRIKKRSLSWTSWRNYFAAFDNQIDFRFSKRGKSIVLYPVCGGRNSLRGQLFLEFEPIEGGGTLIHVEVRPPDLTLFFVIWFGFTAISAITSLFSRNWIGFIVGAGMISGGAVLLHFMRRSALDEVDNIVDAFRDFVSDDYVREQLTDM